MTTEPFRILGASRPSRWLVTCDHATNRVPDCIGGGSLGIAPADMERHIAYDIGAAGVTRRLAERLGAPAILSDFSRLVIDPNRGEDDPTLVMKLYDGTIIPVNRHVDAAEVERRPRPCRPAYGAAVLRDQRRRHRRMIGRPPVRPLARLVDRLAVALDDEPGAGRRCGEQRPECAHARRHPDQSRRTSSASVNCSPLAGV